MKVFLCSNMKEKLKLCCLYKGPEVKRGKLSELLIVSAFLLWFVLHKTYTAHIFNYWSHIIAEKYKVDWKSPLCWQRGCGFGIHSIQHMPSWHPLHMDVSEQEDVPTQSNRLGKKILLYFYLNLMKKMMVLKERERAPLLIIACPRDPAGHLAKGPMGANYGSQLLPLHPGSPKSQTSEPPRKRQGPRKQLRAATLLSAECSSSFPIYRSSSGLYHSRTFAPKDFPVV